MCAHAVSGRDVVYLDHAATSWPKPPEVIAAVTDALHRQGGNPGRGAHQLAMAAGRAIFEAREACSRLLDIPDSRDLIFQPGCTHALNLVLKGLLRPGDRVVAASMEHNAVARPLNVLAAGGVRLDIVTADETGAVDPDAIEAEVRRAKTRMVVCLHVSNVTGAIQPIGDLADIAHENGALLVVDGAQAVGHLDVSLERLGVDAYAASGHKGLLGPQGVGLLYLAPGVDPDELVQGGTGAGGSEEATQPKVRPERYEAGTPNTSGIAGLGAAALLLAEQGERFRSEERRLTRRLHEGVARIGGFRVLGPPPDVPRGPVLAVVHDRVDAERLAFLLDKRYGIAARAGLHCAPWAHSTLGTGETGALRFGVGWSTSEADVDATLQALEELAS